MPRDWYRSRRPVDLPVGLCDFPERMMVPRLTGKDARIGHLATLFRRGAYVPGDTVRELAAEWELGEASVQDMVSQAARIVRLEIADPDRITIKSLSAIERIADEAMIGEDDDGQNLAYRKLALSAYGELMVKSGAAAPTRSIVASVDLTTLTDEQLAEKRRALVASMVEPEDSVVTVTVEAERPELPPMRDPGTYDALAAPVRPPAVVSSGPARFAACVAETARRRSSQGGSK